MSDALPKFKDDALLDVVARTRGAFDQCKQKITNASEDIVAAEKFLADQVVREEFYLQIKEKEAVGWAKDKHGNFRLMYSSDDEKPLIETKVETRLRMHALLPKFIEAFAAHLSNPHRPAPDPGIEGGER